MLVRKIMMLFTFITLLGLAGCGPEYTLHRRYHQ